MFVSNNKRIVKNTFFLYIRMFLTLLVGVYSSRLTLKVLGIDDYGINSVVGGIVVLSAFIKTPMNAAVLRFLNVELGKEQNDRLNLIFCSSMVIYLALAAIIFVLAETVGIVIFYRLNLPPERVPAAFWCYQFSILTFLFVIIQCPYNSVIVAYEHMAFYSYLSIFESILRLISIALLFWIPSDKLILLGGLHTLVGLIIFLCHWQYCRRRFPITRFSIPKDKSAYSQLLHFSFWSLFGACANMTSLQLLNIIINLYCGVAINAAASVGMQLAHVIQNFVVNVQVAFRPQIVKLYAGGTKESFHNLVFLSSKVSFFLFMFLSIPLIITCPFVLSVWLEEPPPMAVEFCRLILIYLWIDAFCAPLWMVVEATGDIKLYEIIVSGIIFLTLPLAWLCLRLGMPGYSIWFVKIFVILLVFAFRLVFLNVKFQFHSKDYVFSILLRMILVCIPSFSIPLIANHFCHNETIAFFAVGFSSVIASICSIVFLGLNSEEKEVLLGIIRSKLNARKQTQTTP